MLVVQMILTVVLLVLLTACGTRAGVEPSSHVVKEAIALQFSQVQQQLSQQLQPFNRPQPPRFAIQQVNISQQQPLTIEKLPAYRVEGTYDVKLRLPKRKVTQKQNPFAVYIQNQKAGKTWRLAIPQFTSKSTVPTWRTYLIQSPSA